MNLELTGRITQILPHLLLNQPLHSYRRLKTSHSKL
nr:MAG TPA: hypothetical protein [Caudoviricetes sp.]